MLGPYLDGELEAEKLIEIDEHVGHCETCREEVQLLRAIRGSLKRVAHGVAPAGLRERIGNAMAAERAREGARADAVGDGTAVPPIVSLASWRTMVPLATAAALALMWGAATRATQSASNDARLEPAGVGNDLLAEIVAEHSSPLPVEVREPEDVRRLERYVGVPVRPASFKRDGMNARFEGARIVPLHAQRATMLQYVVQTGTETRRVSLFVYDAQKIQIATANLAPREVGTAEVRVGREKGYSVAATERAGVGYVVTGDLDPDRSAELAAMVYNER
jgi:anti-sigma factor RsiW